MCVCIYLCVCVLSTYIIHVCIYVCLDIPMYDIYMLYGLYIEYKVMCYIHIHIAYSDSIIDYLILSPYSRLPLSWYFFSGVNS